MMGAYSKIPLQKLKQIHYAQLKVIETREKEGKIEGAKVGGKNLKEVAANLENLLKDIFVSADKSFQGEESLLGMHYYIALLQSLPLSKVRKLEHDVFLEIKKRRELERQRIDAGNIDKIVKQELQK